MFMNPTKDYHKLTLKDYVGPYPVGPKGYRQKLVIKLIEDLEENIKFGIRTFPKLDNSHRKT